MNLGITINARFSKAMPKMARDFLRRASVRPILIYKQRDFLSSKLHKLFVLHVGQPSIKIALGLHFCLKPFLEFHKTSQDPFKKSILSFLSTEQD